MTTVYDELKDKTRSKFEEAVGFVLQAEGGYVSAAEARRRGDRGGETNMGISKRAHPTEDLPNMTVDRAKQIYKRDYWDRVRGDELPKATAFIALDYAVNSGPGRVHKALRRAVGLPEKGELTPQVMRRLRKIPDRVLARHLLQDRAEFILVRSSVEPQHARGWAARLKRLAKEAGKRVEGDTQPQVLVTSDTGEPHGGQGPDA